jgi:DUF4097 and DUF4098 domain-containing protein YvlB
MTQSTTTPPPIQDTDADHADGAIATFDTAQPISVTADLGVGDLRIVAGDRNDTVVEVRPSNAEKKDDITAARQTRVEFDGGRLQVTAPKSWKRYGWGSGGSIDVRIAVPTGSHVHGETGMGVFRGVGQLGACRFKTGMGAIHVDAIGPAWLRTGMGDIVVDRVDGRAELSTGTGSIQVGVVDGAAVIKNSNGDTWVGEVTGDLQLNAANGKISIDRAHAAVAARTANGDVRIGEVSRGAIVAATALGKIDVGISTGVAAWLDLDTRFGTVQSSLEAGGPPQPGEDSVEVRARTACGDISVRRISPAAPAVADPT